MDWSWAWISYYNQNPKNSIYENRLLFFIDHWMKGWPVFVWNPLVFHSLQITILPV